MSDQPSNQPANSGFLIARHQIIVDGQIIYTGEDWDKADNLFTKHVQRLDVRQVIHQVDKSVVSYDH
jgi:hypothetical protein